VIRRVLLVLVAAGLAALAFWLPREEDVAADMPVAEMPSGVGFQAERATAVAPFVERWDLRFPEVPPALHTIRLDVGAVDTATTGATTATTATTAATASGRLTSGSGSPKTLLDRIAVVLGAKPDPTKDLPPVTALDVRLELLGDRLSVGHGDIGATVIAGAFVATPAGDWRVYKLTLGEAGPQCFLGLSPGERSAVLLPRAFDDGPAILARFRSLLGRPTT
jgi:hypothetical protein